MCTILIVIIVKIISLRSFLFECVLYNHSFKTNPNSVTNLSKLYNAAQTMKSAIFALATAVASARQLSLIGEVDIDSAKVRN